MRVIPMRTVSVSGNSERCLGPVFSTIYEFGSIQFSLTVKVATLIFISGHGSAISSAKEGKSGFIYNLGRANMKILTLYTLNSHLFTLKEHNHKMYVFLSSTKIFEAS